MTYPLTTVQADARMMSLCAPICAVQAVQKLPEKVRRSRAEKGGWSAKIW